MVHRESVRRTCQDGGETIAAGQDLSLPRDGDQPGRMP
jgi:hypothetical protein